MESRRDLFRRAGALAVSAVGASRLSLATGVVKRTPGIKVRLALNAYSFNKPLMAGQMTLEDVVDYCASQGLEGLDATGYYFKGYPNVPNDETIFRLKKRAYVNGVSISGTGVRNDFTIADPDKRRQQIQLVKDWIVASEKLGASFIRVFSGPSVPKDSTFDKVLEWMIPAFQECADFGKDHGVIVALQHHDDFLKTAHETIRVVDAVNSDWFSVVLDVGSVRKGDPYLEIEKLLPYACTWQIKENVYFDGKATPIDIPRIRQIIEKVGYRGFLPIEALGQGDQKAIVTAFLEKVRKGMAPLA